MLDQENMFAWQQAIGANSAVISQNVVDLWGPDAGGGQVEAIEIIAEPTAGGTLEVEIQTSAEEAANYTAVGSIRIDSDAMTRGGAVGVAYIPTGMKQYARLSFTGTVATVVTAGIAAAGQTNVGKKILKVTLP